MAASTSRRPRKCPVCASPTIRRYNLTINVENRNPPQHQSYKCGNGHVFVVEKAKAASETKG
jgi:transposase-like protein